MDIKNISKYIMIFLFFFISCSQDDFSYRLIISNDEYKIMRDYIKRCSKIKYLIKINKNIPKNEYYIFSNDEELLIKIKKRLVGINTQGYSHGPFVPIIIKHGDKYYDAYTFENLDWLNDEEIYNNSYPDMLMEIELNNIPDELMNLPEEDFLKYYFDETNEGEYKCNIIIERTLFSDDKNIKEEQLLQNIINICMIKDNYLVIMGRGRIYIEEIRTKYIKHGIM